MRLIDADAITYELWTTEVEVDKSRDNGTYHYFQNRFMVDRRAIEAMPTVQRWISCSERLPTYDDGDGVLVSTTKAFGGLVEVVAIWTSSVELYYQKGWVTAWMPLPEPYRGDNE